jgi:hypothetical protein
MRAQFSSTRYAVSFPFPVIFTNGATFANPASSDGFAVITNSFPTLLWS